MCIYVYVYIYTHICVYIYIYICSGARVSLRVCVYVFK